MTHRHLLARSTLWFALVSCCLLCCQQVAASSIDRDHTVTRGKYTLEWKRDKKNDKKKSKSKEKSEKKEPTEPLQARVIATPAPSPAPTENPTSNPTETPTPNPTDNPTSAPTQSPTESPTSNPTENPTMLPSSRPSMMPSGVPTSAPTAKPSLMPSKTPSKMPSKTPSSSPTGSPTISPTDQCETSSFTSFVEGGEPITVSFTSELIFEVDCTADVENKMILETTLLSYQNDLLAQAGCSDEMQYVAGVISDICPLNIDGECGDIQDICGSTDVDTDAHGEGGEQRRKTRMIRRKMQTTSINSAKVRYRYNSMGNCRRQCAEQSMPKESDVVDTKRRSLQEDADDRSQLVGKLNDAGIPTYGASVLSDGKNNCSPGSSDCCGDDGKCCGVVKGCKCPSVSESVCKATGCDLPGCCGVGSPSWLASSGSVGRFAAPTFPSCPYDNEVCQCTNLFLCEAEIGGCGQYSVCSGNAENVCP